MLTTIAGLLLGCLTTALVRLWHRPGSRSSSIVPFLLQAPNGLESISRISTSTHPLPTTSTSASPLIFSHKKSSMPTIFLPTKSSTATSMPKYAAACMACPKQAASPTISSSITSASTCRYTAGHESRPVAFCLIVDDFGIKYDGKEHAAHLISAIQDLYQCTVDWDGRLFCGITLNWDYVNRKVTLSMPGYIEKALHKYQHPPPARPEHSPSPYSQISYDSKSAQLTKPPDLSRQLTDKEIAHLQGVTGTFLFYGRAIDSTMLVALSTFAAATNSATLNLAKALTQFLNYAATHPDATITYHASDMILHTHSDASYLSEPKAPSRAGGIHYLSNRQYDNVNNINGAILVISQIMKNVLSSAAEAELGALFINCVDAVAIRTMLTELGHQQPAMPVQTDNSTAEGIVNRTVKKRRSKAIDMRYYWLQDHAEQGIFWRRGIDNHADYFTKHHPPSHHHAKRPLYINNLRELQALRSQYTI